RPAALVWWLLLWFALRAIVSRGLRPLDVYDESLLYTDAFLMNQGEVPYRDFYANYPPGVFQVVRLIMGLGLPVIWSPRLLALGVRIASALLAARLAGLRGAYLCMGTLIGCLMFQQKLGLTLFAYTMAVLIALVLLTFWPEPEASPRRFVLS